MNKTLILVGDYIPEISLCLRLPYFLITFIELKMLIQAEQRAMQH